MMFHYQYFFYDGEGVMWINAFENMVLRRIFGSKRKELKKGENYIMRNFVISTLHQI
jgi:hypothetical protein